MRALSEFWFGPNPICQRWVEGFTIYSTAERPGGTIDILWLSFWGAFMSSVFILRSMFSGDPYTPRWVQMAEGGNKKLTRIIKFLDHVLLKLCNILILESDRVEFKRGAPWAKGKKKTTEASEVGYWAIKRKQSHTSSHIFSWQERYGGRWAEKPSIPKRSHHFPIITQEESH